MTRNTNRHYIKPVLLVIAIMVMVLFGLIATMGTGQSRGRRELPAFYGISNLVSSLTTLLVSLSVSFGSSFSFWRLLVLFDRCFVCFAGIVLFLIGLAFWGVQSPQCRKSSTLSSCFRAAPRLHGFMSTLFALSDTTITPSGIWIKVIQDFNFATFGTPFCFHS